MTEINLPPRGKARNGPPGLKYCPGRNDPRIGAWMIETLCPLGKPLVIADPMCGGGQLWMLRPEHTLVQGCELVSERRDIARQNGLVGDGGQAEAWAPPILPVGLVAFSPPYPNCDHSSGKTDHQRSLVASKGLQAMQAIEQVPCMWRVFAQIATYHGAAPVAVIVKNYVRDQVEVDWVSEIESSMIMAGLGQVERYFRLVRPGPTEQWKLKRNPAHRWIDREWVLVARSA